MLELIYTSTKTVSGDFFTGLGGIFFIKDIDAILAYHSLNALNTNLHKIFRDGTTCFTGKVDSDTWSIMSLDRGRICWHDNTFGFCMSDEIAFQIKLMDSIAPNLDISPNNKYGTYIDLNKRIWIGWRGGGLYSLILCKNTDTNENLWSFNLSSGYLGSNQVVNYVDIDHVMLTGSSSSGPPGRSFGHLINVNTGAVISTVEFPYSLRAVYDCNHGIFITIGTDYKVYVYANDYYPYAFGSIIPEHYGLYSYIGQDIKVRLTAVGGFACPNRLVTWQIPTSLGSLEKVVSMTDADGYAWNYYYGPTVAGGLETIKVNWG